MKVQFINSFLESTKHILREYGIRGDIVVRKNNTQCNDVVAIVGLTEAVKGNVAFGMSDDTAKGLASQMMCGMQFENVDDFVKSAICEFANMASGNAVINIRTKGLMADITTPTIITDGNYNVSVNNGAARVGVATDFGNIELSIEVESR